jgi:putative transcriptional regulator
MFSKSCTIAGEFNVSRSNLRIQNTIRTLRFHHSEMTQQALAEQIGVTRQTVNAIEGGKYSPSLEVAFRIAEVFNKPLEEVFQYIPNPE